MARNREIFGFNGIGTKMPDAGVLMDAQRAAAENAAHMASTACHYTMSMNRALLEFWGKHLAQYTELPKRLADAQSDFLQRAFGHYQESIQQLSGLAQEAEEEMEEAVRETEKAGERVAQRSLEEANEIAKAAKPKEARPSRSGDERREGEQPRAAH